MNEIIRNICTNWLSFSILRTSHHAIKLKFREIEKISLKIAKTESHLSFNETCVINRLLPTYTNVRLHDDAASSETFVSDFRLELVKRQIAEQKKCISSLRQTKQNLLNNFRTLAGSELRFSAFALFLDRVVSRQSQQSLTIQNGKLANLYGSSMMQKQPKDSVINMSNVELDDDMLDIFFYWYELPLEK